MVNRDPEDPKLKKKEPTREKNLLPIISLGIYNTYVITKVPIVTTWFSRVCTL